MTTYQFLQHYWWLVISLLGALLVFLMFVQGGNSTIFCLGKTEEQKKLLINSTGRKWEFTFTTLVTFGGAAFASFPLFYSTSFGGAYWLWMIILFSFVIQAVSYEFQSKAGNLLGKTTYRACLVINGFIGPLFLGVAVAMFFTGADFIVDRSNIGNFGNLTISQWVSPAHGLEAFGNFWNWCLGLAVFFLARVLGILYFINSILDVDLIKRCRRALLISSLLFLAFFLTFLIRTLIAPGYAVDPETGVVFMEPHKYFRNFIDLWVILIIFLVGVLLVLFGIGRTIFKASFDKGIWYSGIGTVFTVFSLLIITGYNNTPFYPSYADLQNSLTIENSSSSEFTLKVMAYVSIWVPFLLCIIFYTWRKIDSKKITPKELDDTNSSAY